MTAHSCAGGLKKKFDLWSGSHAIDILTCPSKHPFYGNSEKPDISITQWESTNEESSSPVKASNFKLFWHQTADQPTTNQQTRNPVLLSKQVILSYIHTRQPTNPRPMPTNFYGLVGYDRVKNYPLWLKSVSIPDPHPLYPRFIPDAPTLKSRSSRPTPSFRLTNPRSARPTPDLFLM